MQVIHQILRSYLIIGFVIFIMSLTHSTNCWGNIYSAQQQDTVTEASLDSFITIHAVPEKYSTALRTFYQGNMHLYVWIQSRKIKDHTKDFIAHANKLAEDWIDSSFVELLTLQSFNQNVQQTNIELAVSLSFFKYADKWLMPSDIDPAIVNWRIPKTSLTLANQLKNWLNPTTKMGFNTGSQNFKQLLENYASLSNITALDSGIHISSKHAKINKGEMVPVIRQIKKKLQLLGDFKSTDTTSLFSNTLGIAINRFQERMGLVKTTYIDKALLQALQKPIKHYAKRLPLI